ncbi:extracellular solute-binding protein [Bengtsoniella intestinalis]|uniref:extracellular solute-binding protein n=1 Tax=Bengtsoniella intestinalis TaxID=3073143 RepID=UPI00391EFAF1
MKKALSLLLALTMSLALASCASSETTTETTAPATTETTTAPATTEAVESELPDPATAAPIVVYLNDFDAVIGDAFYEATGYQVEVFVGNGAEIASRIEAEGDNPLWDVVWMDSMPSMYAMGENGQLLTNYEIENAANLTDYYAEIVPEDGRYYPTGAHSAGLLVYNTDVYTAETAPKTFDDLLNADAGYKVGMANPSVAAPAYPLVAWFMDEYRTDDSLDGGFEFFSTLLDNGMTIYPKNPQIVTALSSGEIDVAILQESNAYDMLNTGEPVALIWPEDGAPASVRVAGICAQSDNVAIAKLFIEFLLEAETQQMLVDLGDEGYFTPSVEGAYMNDQRAADNATLVYADTPWAAANEAEIKAWFADQAG